jgi:thiol-disulfide isomerase/thioredoxin
LPTARGAFAIVAEIGAVAMVTESRRASYYWRRMLGPILVLLALVAADQITRSVRRRHLDEARATRNSSEQPLQFLAAPYTPPPFAAIDLDGRDVSLTNWRGKVVLVNFWATWCLPCRKELPVFASLHDRFNANLVVLGVVEDAPAIEFLRAFTRNLGVSYPIVRTTTAITGSFSEPLVLPTTYVIDRAGRVVSVHLGEIDASVVEREVLALIKAAPAAPSPPD